MSRSSTRLPPLSSLLAFEAAARHLSFTRASFELNITQGAISQRIKLLEGLLGQTLFVRDGNAIRLTDAGATYLTSVRTAIRELIGATDRAISGQRGDVLTVGCLGSFALARLVPKLGEFRARFPAINLRLRTPVPFELASADDYDVSIEYGQPGRWPHKQAVQLGEDYLVPVCSPDLLGRSGFRTPADLARHTVIRTLSSLVLQDEWPLWLREAGVADLTFEAELTFDFLHPSYQAAMAGLGVAMGRVSLIGHEIGAGHLVEPFPLRLPSIAGYHLVVAPERAELPKVANFIAWATDALRFMP